MGTQTYTTGNRGETNPARTFQAKLEIGQPGDRYEREADAVADNVVRGGALSISSGTPPAPPVQRKGEEEEPMQMKVQRKGEEEEEMLQAKCAACAEEESMQMQVQRKGEEEEESMQMQVQRKGADEEEMLQPKCAACAAEEQMQPAIMRAENGTAHTSPAVTSQIASTRGKGQALPTGVQQQFGGKMGADFSGVNIHTDSTAVQLSKSLGAHAFTVGNDIYFNSGKYDTASRGGQHLLAHELTHTIQQGGSKQPGVMQKTRVQRQTTPPHPVNTYNDCTAGQEAQIQGAFNDAIGHVNRATAALANAYATHPRLPNIVSNGLNTHFHTTDKDDIMTIYRRFRDIQNAMQRGINFECETSCDPGVGGYVWQFLFWQVGRVHVCFNLFTNSGASTRKAIVIHEIAHRHAGVDDKAYVWQPNYPTLSAKDAMNNADSYAHFALLF
ncbi:MAG: DUF4157 domain-containing protein [Flavobacteriales bacterium]|nr:DUF4157 domain-containing protein [Flavobacteriales bacterium]MCB9448607.1 DUF4157 domain-containing protein [Flavobacteriales bacterium]